MWISTSLSWTVLESIVSFACPDNLSVPRLGLIYHILSLNQKMIVVCIEIIT